MTYKSRLSFNDLLASLDATVRLEGRFPHDRGMAKWDCDYFGATFLEHLQTQLSKLAKLILCLLSRKINSVKTDVPPTTLDLQVPCLRSVR
jgi:hypothetical protein